MLVASDEARFFDTCKPELLARYTGQFAVVCGRRLIGVHVSLEEALRAAGEAFGRGELEDEMPILISEIAETTKVRVVAEPRTPTR